MSNGVHVKNDETGACITTYVHTSYLLIAALGRNDGKGLLHMQSIGRSMELSEHSLTS